MSSKSVDRFDRFSNSDESFSSRPNSPDEAKTATAHPVENSRPPMNQLEFDLAYGYVHPPPGFSFSSFLLRGSSKFWRPFTSGRKFLDTFMSFLPILHWLPRYRWKEDLVHDMIGGVTVGIMHVPQGIAYAVLAGQEPVVGLYTSLFPVFAYMIFGNSRHCSIGSFAIVALMAGQAVTRLSPSSPDSSDSANGSDFHANGTVPEAFQPIQVASTLTFMVGIVQVLVAVCGLDVVTTYFSDQLVNGFTTGASMHVFVTQMKDIFGIYGTPKRTGAGYIFLKLSDLLSLLPSANVVAVGCSACALSVLFLGKYLLNPLFQRKLRSPVPIPFELIVVIAATVVSLLMSLESEHGLHTVGHIPTGLPLPTLPSPSLFLLLLPDAVSICAVVMAIHVSLAKIFAKKNNYEIDANQEFYAMGFSSLLSGFFPNYPNSCSLARTMVNGSAGTRTQLSALFSCVLIFILIQFSGSWLNPLPMCVLGSIIIVALSGMFEKFKELPKLWPVSKTDFFIWVVSFLATVSIDVLLGLVVSIAFALMTTVIRQQWSKWHVLGNVSQTTEYRDIDRYKNIYAFKNIWVVRFDSPLLFTNVERFRDVIWQIANQSEERTTHEIMEENRTLGQAHEKATPTRRHIIIDCSGFVYCDVMGVNQLKEIFVDMKAKDIDVSFAAAKASLREMFKRSGNHSSVPFCQFFPTIHDAVRTAQIKSDSPSATASTDLSSSTSTILV